MVLNLSDILVKVVRDGNASVEGSTAKLGIVSKDPGSPYTVQLSRAGRCAMTCSVDEMRSDGEIHNSFNRESAARATSSSVRTRTRWYEVSERHRSIGDL